VKAKVWVWEAAEGTRSRDRDLCTACTIGTHINMSSRSQTVCLRFHMIEGSGNKGQWANPDDSQRWDTIETQVTVSSKGVQKGMC